MEKENKMGVMPVPKLVILLPCVLLFGTLGGRNMVGFAFWTSEACAFAFAVYCLKKEYKNKMMPIL